jgi:anti-sigma factor RsiW
MNGSRHITPLLYEYCAGTLPPDQHEEVRRHLESCSACMNALRDLQEIINRLPADGDPASTLPAAFWQELLNDVTSQLPARPRNHTPFAWIEEWWAFISIPRHQWTIGLSATALLVMLLVGSWFIFRSTPIPVQVAATLTPSAKVASPPVVNARLRQYLRKSKALLVEVNNMPLKEGVPVDLSVERQASRALLHEARSLRDLPLDGRSVALISDLEKIQLALANSREQEEIHGIRLIRGGIQDENLLFKIRIAETVFERMEDESQGIKR